MHHIDISAGLLLTLYISRLLKLNLLKFSYRLECQCTAITSVKSPYIHFSLKRLYMYTYIYIKNIYIHMYHLNALKKSV